MSLLVISSAVATSALSWATEDLSCVPVRAGVDPTTLPVSWRTALEALIASTAHEGLPWSCPGGSVTLSISSGAAAGELTVTDAKGRVTTRPVTSPADVGPTGKALLASPRDATPVIDVEASPSRARPPVVAPTPAVVSPRVGESRLPPPADARLVLSPGVGVRVSGPDTTAWMSVSLRGAIPVDLWAVGVWARLDLPLASAYQASPWFSMSSVSIGLSGGRAFPVGPIVIEALVVPSVAVVSMEEERDETIQHPEGARVELRVGAEVAATARLNGWLRGRVALDGEVAPASSLLIAEGFPRVPRYTLGLALGLEAVVH
jgi:hypothetical protein